MSAEPVLVVVHQGASYEARPGTNLTFGRGRTATIRIGADDPAMHRRAGSFRWLDGHWQVHNDGSRCALEVIIDGGLEAHISAGAHPFIIPPGSHGVVSILMPVPHDLAFATPPSPKPPYVPSEEEQDDSAEVSTDGLRYLLGLSDAETRMLVALCEPRLRNPRLKDYEIPSSAALCARLDLNSKKVEDLVDGLALKLSRHVPGLIGSNTGRAVNRRQRIAAFALDTRCVTVSDLRLLTLER